jgi:RNA polymerase sigma factor (sigma-70 family)
VLAEQYARLGTPSRHAIAREALARVEAAFDRLPEDYREVIVLHRIAGLSHREIGERLDRSEIASQRLLARALARLSTLLSRG